MQLDVLDLVKDDQIIYVEDANGKSRPFGVHTILNNGLITCQALGKESTSLNADNLNRVTIISPRENGAYLVKAEIVESDEEGYRTVFRPAGDIKHIQRRKYFRISKPSLSVRYQLIDRVPGNRENIPINCMAWDLSGNGIGIIIRSARTLYTGSEIKILVAMPGEATIEFVGEITRVVPKSIIKNEYLLGIYFKDIRESDRDKIIEFVERGRLALDKVK